MSSFHDVKATRYDFCAWKPSRCSSVGLESEKAKGVLISEEMDTSWYIYAYKYMELYLGAQVNCVCHLAPSVPDKFQPADSRFSDSWLCSERWTF